MSMINYRDTLVLGDTEWLKNFVVDDKYAGSVLFKRHEVASMVFEHGYKLPTVTQCILLNRQLNLLQIHNQLPRLLKKTWATGTRVNPDALGIHSVHNFNKNKLVINHGIILAHIRLVRKIPPTNTSNPA